MKCSRERTGAARTIHLEMIYLRRDEADSMDALDALKHATERLDAVEREINDVRKQLNSIVGKRFDYELFKPAKFTNPPDAQGGKRQKVGFEA